MNAHEGMLIYRKEKMFRVVLSGGCSECYFYDGKRCICALCTRFRQWARGEALTFRFVDKFKPEYLDLITWTSETQRKTVYEDYQREIEEYNREIAGEVY